MSGGRSNHFIDRSPQESLGRDAARGGLATLISHGLRFAIHMGSTMALARLLEIEDFGTYAIATAFTMILAKFRDGGLRLANVQAALLTHGQATTLLLINVGIGVGLAATIFVAGFILAGTYGEPNLQPVMLILGFSYFAGAIGVQFNGVLHRRMQLFAMGCIEVGALAISVGVGVFFAWIGAGVFALAYGHLALNLSKTVGSVIFSRWLPSRPAPLSEIKPMVGFGATLAMSGAVNQAGANADRAMLGAIDTHATGLYGKALNLATMPLELISPAFATVAMPALSSLTDEPNKYRRAYDRLLTGMELLSVPCFCVIVLEADWLVTLALGEKWGAAVPLFRYLALGSIFLPLWNSGGWLLVSQGRGGDMFKWHLLDSGAKIFASAIGVYWGATGLAIAFSVRYLVMMPLYFWWLCVEGPVGRDLLYRHTLVLISLSFPGLAAGWLAIKFNPVDLPGLGATVFLAVYAATVYLLPGYREQVQYFGATVRDRILGGRANA